MKVREAKPLHNAALEAPIDLGIALNRWMRSEGMTGQVGGPG
jgi:hypothetical protein